MPEIRTFKFQLRADPAAEVLLRRFEGQARWVWNRALFEQRARHAHGEKYAGYAHMCKWLTAWRNDPETAWLAAGSVSIQQQVLRRLDLAYKRFFDSVKAAGSKGRRVGIPRPKKRGQSIGLRFPNPTQFEIDTAHSRVKLPKLGWVRLRMSREIEGEIRNVSLVREGAKWYASIQTEIAQTAPALGLAPSLGIDVGVTLFAATSDGQQIAPLKALARQQNRLKQRQRCVSRRKKGSKNRRKAVDRLARLHRRIAKQRNDWLHKLTTELASHHPIIAIEDLKVAAMSASAKGNGRKAKAALNRAILDQGWAEFRRQLQYKLEAVGGELIVVEPAYTSRTCRSCGHEAAESRKTQSVFSCVACGHTEHADVHAAKNILIAGHAIWAQRSAAPAACGEPVRPVRERRLGSAKQEPPEGVMLE